MNLSVCIETIFKGSNAISGMKQTKAAGLDAFEFWTWWDKDLKRMKEVKEELGLTLVTFCTKFISLVDPNQRENYLKGLEESIEAAKFLDCRKLITQVGNAQPGVSREEQLHSLIAGLKACVPYLEKSGTTLLVEPLNIKIDHPGYFLYSSDEAFKVIREVNSPYVKVLFDIYHQQITEGDLLRRIGGNLESIGHFHAAGIPGRNELDTGEINYKNIFRALKSWGYQDYVGLEYFCREDPITGLRNQVKELE